MSGRFSASGALRLVAAALLATSLLFVSAAASNAQLRANMERQRVNTVADVVLVLIRDSSCSDLLSKMQKQKSGGGSSGAGARMQKLLEDPTNRQIFANKIGGPLVDKMLTCKMMPLGS